MQLRNGFPVVLGLAMTALVLVSCNDHDAPWLLVEDHVARCSVILGEAATATERHAAQELQKYVELITGAKIPIVNTGDARQQRLRLGILLGQTSSHPLIAELARKNLVRPPSDDPMGDGYLMQTLRHGTARYLLLTGNSPRAVLYAVYEFLESNCRVGFFLDGEQIPRRPHLEVGNFAVARKPNLRYRGMGHILFSPMGWNAEDRKRWMDWMLKKRMNLIGPPEGGQYCNYLVPQRIGLQTPSARDLFGDTVFYVNYAKKLDLRIQAQGTNGLIPTEFLPQFKSKYPAARYFQTSRDGQNSDHWLYPSDPLFRELQKAYLDVQRDLLGNIAIVGTGPYPEAVFKGMTETEIEQLFVDFAASVPASVRAANPHLTLGIGSEGFLNSPLKPEAQRRFVEALKSGQSQIPIVIWDTYSDAYQHYEQARYFNGLPWVFGEWHQGAPDAFAFGDLAEHLRMIENARKNGCVGIYSIAEIIEPNGLVFDLMYRMAWQSDLKLDSFLREYACLRYGDENGWAMYAHFLKPLCRSIYGAFGSLRCEPEGQWKQEMRYGEPRYHYAVGIQGCIDDSPVRAIYFSPHPEFQRRLDRRLGVVAELRSVLQNTVEHTTILSGNVLYQLDLAEIARQYLAELFNQHLLRLDLAFVNADEQHFREEREAVERCLDLQIDLHRNMGDHPAFSVAAFLKRSSRPDFSRTELIKWTTNDYWRQDRQEVLEHYYKPRVVAYVAALERLRKDGRHELPLPAAVWKALKTTYDDIARQFGQASFERIGERREIRSTVKRILHETEALPRLQPVSSARSAPGK